MAPKKDDIEKILRERSVLVDKTIEKWLPRSFDSRSMEFAFGKARYRFSPAIADKALARPVWDLLDRGGKRWRPVLFLLTCDALGGRSEKFVDLAVLVELIHNGSLIIDDIEDSSDLRRGKPATYKIYGTDIAINAGNFAYFHPLLTLLKNKSLSQKQLLRVYEIYAQELINIHLGQAMDIAWHRGLAEPGSADEYFQMCAFKTGTLARLAAKLGALCAGADENKIEVMGRLAESLGIAFQIQDDVLNLTATSGRGQFAKQYLGEDIREGKRSLMVIHTLGKASKKDRARLLKILNKRTSDRSMINEAISILEKYDSFDYAKQKARAIVADAWDEAEPLLRDSEAKQELLALVKFVIEREY